MGIGGGRSEYTFIPPKMESQLIYFPLTHEKG